MKIIMKLNQKSKELFLISSSNDNLQDFFGINFGKEHKFNLSNPAKFFKKSV